MSTSSRPPNETVEEYVPLLGSIARLLQRFDDVTRDQLDLLFLGSGVDADPAMVEEVERWLRILRRARDASDDLGRQVAIEALILRGIPEGPATLAVHAVGERLPETTPPPAGRLQVSVDAVDLGMLAPGQSARAQFEVAGAGGHVEVDDAQVRVSPAVFLEAPTTLTITAEPAAGGVIMAGIRLVAGDETVEVPFIAQWDEAVSEPTDPVQAMSFSPATPATPQQAYAVTHHPPSSAPGGPHAGNRAGRLGQGVRQGAPMPPNPPSAPAVGIGWQCTKCSRYNPLSYASCQFCGGTASVGPRPRMASSTPPQPVATRGRAPTGVGKQCTGCGEYNYLQERTCWNCKRHI